MKSEKIDNTRASVGSKIPFSSTDHTDPDRYMHHGEETPALKNILQRVHPKLLEITDFSASIGSHISRIGRTGFTALRFERKVLGAILDALIEEQNPDNGPLLEVVAQYQARVERVIDGLLNPRRQEDLLEQPSATVAPVQSLRTSSEDDRSPSEAGKEGDSEFRVCCGHCGRVLDAFTGHYVEDGIFCSIVCAAECLPEVAEAAGGV